MLVAHLDALFDRGLISVDDAGPTLIAAHVAAEQRAALHLDEGLPLPWPDHVPVSAPWQVKALKALPNAPSARGRASHSGLGPGRGNDCCERRPRRDSCSG